MSKLNYLYISILLLAGCGYTKPMKVNFSEPPTIPDYKYETNWSALPDKKDSADHVPAVGLSDGQINAKVDVFFVHPTSFFSRKQWNASIEDEKVNIHTDEGAIFHQASVFNESCRVYAPRYRQVAFQAFFTPESTDSEMAFDIAYQDVANAFKYYMENYNNGRPFFIAAHSQGTVHAIRLIQEFIDTTAFNDQFIAAYLIGMPVDRAPFENIPVCESEDQTDCFVSWRSYLEGNYPKAKYTQPYSKSTVVVNPLTWTTDTAFADKSLNIGGLGRKGEQIYPKVASTKIYKDYLWVSKPDIPGKILLWNKNYHRAEYNLYWMNIRYNVAVRANKWLESNH